MTSELLCAVCLSAGQSAASHIVYVAPGGQEHPIQERAGQFAERIAGILSGEDPNLEPGGYFRINNLDRLTCVAITWLAGTAVCGSCLYAVLHDRQQNRTSYGNRSVW